MRLLLLLSALLAALTGATGTRTTAQPVQASAIAAVAVRRVTTVSPASLRFPVPSYASLPPLRLASSLAPVVISRVLYAERRRE